MSESEPLKQYSDLLDLAESNLTAALSLVQAQKQGLKYVQMSSDLFAHGAIPTLQFLNSFATLKA